MRTINLRTHGLSEAIAARLQTAGYTAVLKLYEYEGGIRLTLQWDRQDRVPGGRIDRTIWLTDDGYLAPEINVDGRDIEGTQTVDVDAALAEIERMVAAAMPEAA